MNFLVTGGAGFIGSHFVDFLLFDNNVSKYVENVTVLDKLTYAGSLSNLNFARQDSRFRFVKGDIRNSKIIRKLLSDKCIVVNFAAESHVDNSINNASVFYETNTTGVVALLEATRFFNGVKFLQISTDEVYGSITKGAWTEESILQPNSPYSSSKASSDLICRAYFKTYGLDIVITRCSNNFGPRQHNEKFIPTIFNCLFQNKKIPVYGDGNNVRDWLFVSDHVKGIWAAILYGKTGEVYNIGGGSEMSNLELSSFICTKMGYSSDQIEFTDDRKGHDRRYSLDFLKATRELGYKPSVSFDSGVELTMEYYKGISKATNKGWIANNL